MASNRFANTLRGVRQHNYGVEDDNSYQGQFRDNSSSKVFYSIKPSDQISQRINSQNTLRPVRSPLQQGLASRNTDTSGVTRYADMIKIGDRKPSYTYTNTERPSYTQRESSYTQRDAYTGQNNIYKNPGLTERSPVTYTQNQQERSPNSQLILRSRSGLKPQEHFQTDRFQNTIKLATRDSSNPTYSASRRTLYGNTGRADQLISGIKYEDDDGKSPYKRYILDRGQYDNLATNRSKLANGENVSSKYFFQGAKKGPEKSTSSIISSKSYEIYAAKENANDTGYPVSYAPSSSKRNLTSGNNYVAGTIYTNRESLIPERDQTTGRKSNNLFFDFTQRSANQATANKDSFIYKNAYDANSVANTTQDNRGFYNYSPAISARREISALDRSELSNRSKISNTNSCITRRDTSAGPSQIRGIGCESRAQNMSKTWVKSNLLESREDISTMKYKKNNVMNISQTTQQPVTVSTHSAVVQPSNTKQNTSNSKLDLDNLFTMESRDSASQTTKDARAKEYELKKCIGQGAYAKVYKALHIPTNTKVAVKLYEKSKLSDKLRQKSIKREIKILSKIQHENIVNFIDCFATNNHIYLVMELVEGLSLYELLKKQPKRKISEENARSIIKQILRALNYCHSRNVTHRDIKLENVIVSNEGVVKLIDFGFSTCIPNESKKRLFCGTPSYMAPEIVKKIEYRGPPVDIWATGVLFYVLLSGKFPFRGSTDKKLYYRISYADVKFNEDIRQEVQDIINVMMSKEAEERPSCKTVKLSRDFYLTNKLLEGYFCSRKYTPSTTQIAPAPQHTQFAQVTSQGELTTAQHDQPLSKNARSHSAINHMPLQPIISTSNILKERNISANKTNDISSQFTNLLRKVEYDYSNIDKIDNSSSTKASSSRANLKQDYGITTKRDQILQKYLDKSPQRFAPLSTRAETYSDMGYFDRSNTNRALQLVKDGSSTVRRYGDENVGYNIGNYGCYNEGNPALQYQFANSQAHPYSSAQDELGNFFTSNQSPTF